MNIGSQLTEVRLIRSSAGSDQHITCRPTRVERGQHFPSTDLTQPSLQSIPFHDLPPVLRHDETEA
jgi:hypothetical protein